MQKIPIARSKVREIIEIAEVTRSAEQHQKDESSSPFAEVFSKVEKGKQGIPAIGAALYRSIEDLTDEERIALLLLVQKGRGVLKNINRNTAATFMSTPDVEPVAIPQYLVELDELPKYGKKGLSELDEMIE